MTKVNIISGFLGAGKTTLIKKLLAGGGFEGEKLVLLENEYGEVGVDGAFMKNTGIEITELNSGCICCTLAGDFHDALIDLIDKYRPDRVIIEPSGVGKLSEVRNVIAGLAREVEGISLEACATVCDVNRARVYARNFGEFFTDQIEAAECVILSRTQMTTPEKLEKALELIRAINSEARIVTTPWEELDAATLLNAITADRPLVDDFDEDAHHHHDHCEHHDHDHHDHDHNHHDHDHDHEHHDHDHEHHHGHGHDADEVFEDIGVETAKAFTQAEIESALDALHDVDRFGSVLRAKGVVKLDDGEWAHFDYVPGAGEVRRGEPDYTGRLCVIGVGLDGAALKGCSAVTRKEGVPVYIITGFLDAGKTKFIMEMLADEGFSEGERTLIFRCEEGEEEYDPVVLKKANTVVRDLVSPEDMDETLIRLDKEISPERIIFEYNSTWTMERLYDAPKPEEWELAQIVTVIDATTFEMYIQNMRDFMTDGIKEADLVLFNRCTDKTPKGKYRRTAKALNNSVRVYFENPDGTTDDGVTDEDLPYDMAADPIEIPDEMFGIWYLDAMEHPTRYDGKNLKFKVQAAYMKGMPNKTYIASRQAMTCCADDIGGIGFVCKTENTLPTRGKYYEVVAKAEKAMSPIHGREAIILIQKSVKSADKPKDEVVYFN